MSSHRARWFASLLMLIAIALSGCASDRIPNAGTHTVKRGETLYRIATRYGLDYRELARLNHLDRDYTIHPGQVLRLSGKVSVARTVPRSSTQSPSASTPLPTTLPSVAWRWPVNGKAVLTQRPNGGHGLTIAAPEGVVVQAAADGRVVYTGAGLLGYGQLVIIKHNDYYLSTYGHAGTIAVKEGDVVKAGQSIATVGAGPSGEPMLYFEIRVNGKPQDPLSLLPRQ